MRARNFTASELLSPSSKGPCSIEIIGQVLHNESENNFNPVSGTLSFVHVPILFFSGHGLGSIYRPNLQLILNARIRVFDI